MDTKIPNTREARAAQAAAVNEEVRAMERKRVEANSLKTERLKAVRLIRDNAVVAAKAKRRELL